MSTAIASVQGDFDMSIRAACRALGCGRASVEKLVKSGRLSIRAIPGAPAKLRSAEVKALVEKHTRPARPDAPAALAASPTA